MLWSRRWDLNPRPTVYKTVALPLSYFGKIKKISKFIQNLKLKILIGPGRIRTYEGTRPPDLQSGPVDRFGTDPYYKL